MTVIKIALAAYVHFVLANAFGKVFPQLGRIAFRHQHPFDTSLPSSGIYNENSDDLRYIRDEFFSLSSDSGLVSVDAFIASQEIQALFADQLCTKSEVHNIWMQVVGDKFADLGKFVAVNKAIDDLFDVETDSTDNDESGDLSAEDLDVWDPKFNPATIFEPEFLGYLREYFNKQSTGGFISYESFSEWTDVLELLNRGEIDSDCLKDLWAEAIAESKSLPVDNEGRLVDYDTYLRINIRLEEVLDEISNAIDGLTNEQKKEYYKAEFDSLTGGEELLSYQQLMEWQDIKDIISSSALSREQLNIMWEALPKLPLGSYFKADKGFGSSRVGQSDGIDFKGFEALNEAFEATLEFTSNSSSPSAE